MAAAQDQRPGTPAAGTTPAGAPADPAPPGSFAGARAGAWQALLLYHAAVVAALSAEMERTGLSTGRYDVLVQLQWAPQGLRLKELGERLVISQPGLSRRIDRMARDGLVVRSADPRDGRGVVVSSTRVGRAALRRATARYVPAVQDAFTDHLSEVEAQALLSVLTRLHGVLTERGPAAAGQLVPSASTTSRTPQDR